MAANGGALFKKNIILQIAYQLLNTCLPLITAPYLARTLGPEGLGIFSYTMSVVSYFTLLAMMGTINYGTRYIASVKNDTSKVNRIFWEIYCLQVLFSLGAVFLYIIYLFFFCKENQLIGFIQCISIINCFLDISWLFFGLENFKFTVYSGFAIRVFTVICILAFVNTTDDLPIYTFIMLFCTTLTQLILWSHAKNILHVVSIKWTDVKRHIYPNLILFIPLLAMSVYHSMDKTMLGILSTYLQSGYYYNVDKVVNIPLGIIVGIGTVMLPRMSDLLSSNHFKEAKEEFEFSLEMIVFLSVAMSFGISSIAKEFVPIFFGPGYDDCVLLCIILSPVLIIKGISNTIRVQYLIPMKKEHIFIESVVIGAIINLILDLTLIPACGALGAIVGTLFAELAACIWQIFLLRTEISIFSLCKNGGAYVLAGMVMYIGVRLFSTSIEMNEWKIIFEVPLGGSIYLIICLLYWQFYRKSLFVKIKDFIHV